MKKKVTLIVITFLSCFTYFLQAQKNYIQTVMATRIFEVKHDLTAFSNVTFEARTVSPGADVILHLLSPAGVEVKLANDGGSGANEKLSYRPLLSGRYTLIIRAKTETLNGTADFYKDGVLVMHHIFFGGASVPLKNILANETIQTVKLPVGSVGRDLLYILKPDGIGIRAIASSPDMLHPAKFKFSSNFGNCTALVGTTDADGAIRIVINDALIGNHDPDQDGLGVELEKAIGTCSVLSGFVSGCDCSKLADARDTDGDGISDGWEFLGRNDVSPVQLLPKWGADPRHKDMFIEIDYMRITFAENQGNTSLPMSPDVARHFATVYGDQLTTSPGRAQLHAETMKNPDGRPGISVHMDIGVLPQTDADATIFGNWGGFNGVNAIGPNNTPCTDGVACVGVDAGLAWTIAPNFSDARKGIFRYAMGYTGGGGQCGTGFACDFNFTSDRNSVHEWAHTFNNGHSGPNNITGKIDPNCKTNYPSLLNYAYYPERGVGFSDGFDRSPLNNIELNEWRAIPPGNTEYLDHLETQYKYWVERRHGSVDWNRDGKIEPEGSTVRAFANYKPGCECEFTRYNQLEIEGAETTTTPVLARLNSRLYLFYTKNGAVKYRASDGDWNCNEISDLGCNNASFGAEKDAGFQQSTGVDVMNDLNSLRIVSIQTDGKIIEKRLTRVGNMENLGTPVQIPGLAKGQPALSFGLTGSYLLYKGTDNLIHFNRMVAGVWQTDQLALQANNQSIPSTPDFAFPAIIQAVLPGRSLKELYALIPDASRTLALWCFNRQSQLWEKTNLLEEPAPRNVYNKPAMGFVPYNAQQQDLGRLYIAYATHNSVNVRPTRMRMSYVKVSLNADGSATRTETIGLDSPYDNNSFAANSISFFYEHGSDQNLRALCAIRAGADGFKIRIRPKSDGIQNFRYQNYNDWDMIQQFSCPLVVFPTKNQPNRIKCLTQWQ